MFGWLRRRRNASAHAAGDPLATYDGLLADLERRGAEVRRAAATLLALKGELAREEERFRQRKVERERRQAEARAAADGAALRTFDRDAADEARQVEATRQALARAETDAALLLETGQLLQRTRQELLAERTSARARLLAGGAVALHLREESLRVSELLRLDAARDEIERAHALAELYREERRRPASGTQAAGSKEE